MKTAFLFVDLLEDFFVRPPLCELRASIVRATNELTRYARAHSIPVIWVRQEFEPDLRDAFLLMRDFGARITIKGTDGCKLLAGIEVGPQDYEVIKKRYSAFFGTGLQELLSSLKCEQLVVGGVNSHACVRSTAVDAYQRDLRIVLARDSISSYDDEYHRESMRYLAQSIGKPLSNKQLIEYLGLA